LRGPALARPLRGIRSRHDGRHAAKAHVFRPYED
jgi:hypothetical protein